MQYLTRRSNQADEQQAGEVLEDLENEGYVETISGEQGEDLVRFTDQAIDEVFD